MSTSRPLRTLFQSFLGLISGGVLTEIWNTFVTNHQVDPVTSVTISALVLPALVSFAQVWLEEAKNKQIPIKALQREDLNKD